MDEFLMMRLFGGGLFAGIDLTALLAFIAFAVIYLIVPVLGYHSYRPAGLAASLYLLVAYAGLSLIQLLIQWAQVLEQTGGRGGGRGEAGIHLLFLFALLKMALFVLSMVAFVVGLRSLRLRDGGPEPFPRPFAGEQGHEDR
jgi:hypothetical protein